MATIRLPDQIAQAMVNHAEFCSPNEACGLLAGDVDGNFRMVYCLTNSERSPVRFTIDPVEHFRALKHAERQEWELRGAFHSHPTGPPQPSLTDIARPYGGGWIDFIVHAGSVRAFSVQNGRSVEVPIEPTSAHRDPLRPPRPRRRAGSADAG
jgi:proteasome lid subunit RPN8/RPN11